MPYFTLPTLALKGMPAAAPTLAPTAVTSTGMPTGVPIYLPTDEPSRAPLQVCAVPMLQGARCPHMLTAPALCCLHAPVSPTPTSRTSTLTSDSVAFPDTMVGSVMYNAVHKCNLA
jgi:hypothetical protein